MFDFTKYDNMLLRHELLIEYLNGFLGPLGFLLKEKGGCHYTYVNEGACSYAQKHNSFSSFEEYDWLDDSNVYQLSGLYYVCPPAPIEVEFSHERDGGIEVSLNTRDYPTSMGRLLKHEMGDKERARFRKTWDSQEAFEKEFMGWFTQNGLEIQKI